MDREIGRLVNLYRFLTSLPGQARENKACSPQRHKVFAMRAFGVCGHKGFLRALPAHGVHPFGEGHFVCVSVVFFNYLIYKHFIAKTLIPNSSSPRTCFLPTPWLE